MKNKIPYSQRTFRGKFKYSMLILVILLSVTLGLWVVTVGVMQLSNIAKYNTIVDAPLVSYEVIKHTATHPVTIEINYFYQYQDENGVVYQGRVGANIHDYKTADKAIANGQTVRIYIDGKGNSCPVNRDISQTRIITLLSFSIVLTVVTVVLYCLFLIPIKNKNK